MQMESGHELECIVGAMRQYIKQQRETAAEFEKFGDSESWRNVLARIDAVRVIAIIARDRMIDSRSPSYAINAMDEFADMQ